MDFFNNKKVHEFQITLRKKDAEIRNLNDIMGDYRKKLDRLTKETNSLKKKNIELFNKNQNLQAMNLKLGSEKNQIEKDHGLSQQKFEEEFSTITNSYEQKIIKLNEEHEINVHIAKHTKCKELPNKIELDIQKIIKEKEIGFPWLANAIASFYENLDKIYASYLERKTRPALKQAERIREIGKEKALFKKEFYCYEVYGKIL